MKIWYVFFFHKLCFLKLTYSSDSTSMKAKHNDHNYTFLPRNNKRSSLARKRARALRQYLLLHIRLSKMLYITIDVYTVSYTKSALILIVKHPYYQYYHILSSKRYTLYGCWHVYIGTHQVHMAFSWQLTEVMVYTSHLVLCTDIAVWWKHEWLYYAFLMVGYTSPRVKYTAHFSTLQI